MALSFNGKWSELENRLGDAWLDCSVSRDGTKLRTLFDRADWTVGMAFHAHEFEKLDFDLMLDNSTTDIPLGVILSEWLKISGNTVMSVGPKEIVDPQAVPIGNGPRIERSLAWRPSYHNHFRLRNELQEPFDNSALANSLAQALFNSRGNRRFLLNLDDSFSILWLKPKTKVRARWLVPYVEDPENGVLLPFLFVGNFKAGESRVDMTAGRMDALCRWTQSHLRSPASLDEIHQAYTRLARFIDQMIMRPTIYWENWRRARGLPDESALYPDASEKS
jgi:hypothetical protein